MILGEIDVARVNPCRSGQSEPSVHMSWFAPHRPATVTQFPGATRDLPLTRWMASTRLDHMERLRMGDDVSRGQKEGSVEVLHQYLSKYNGIVRRSFM